jgi:hypothetical protein
MFLCSVSDWPDEALELRIRCQGDAGCERSLFCPGGSDARCSAAYRHSAPSFRRLVVTLTSYDSWQCDDRSSGKSSVKYCAVTPRSFLCNQQTSGLTRTALLVQEIWPYSRNSRIWSCQLTNKNVAKRQILIAYAGKSCGLASGR